MSKIVKTEGFITKTVNYGDTSKIITVFTSEFGKMSGIVKGARNSKSGKGNIVDVLNYVELIFYAKEHAEVKLISQIDLIDDYQKNKNDLELLSYSLTSLELINKLLQDEEPMGRLFRGTKKFLEILGTKNAINTLMARYVIFFTDEIGYKLSIDECSNCGTEISSKHEVSFSFGSGVLCSGCSSKEPSAVFRNAELFEILACLKKRSYSNNLSIKQFNSVINFFERFLMFHHIEFGGIKSLKMF
ncbi:MAG: DNA repair protein RecO [Ignavibacteriales bacterium]|nr:DNA repair protein RecO [Ignavibacteriales bacterium]